MRHMYLGPLRTGLKGFCQMVIKRQTPWLKTDPVKKKFAPSTTGV